MAAGRILNGWQIRQLVIAIITFVVLLIFCFYIYDTKIKTGSSLRLHQYTTAQVKENEIRIGPMFTDRLTEKAPSIRMDIKTRESTTSKYGIVARQLEIKHINTNNISINVNHKNTNPEYSHSKGKDQKMIEGSWGPPPPTGMRTSKTNTNHKQADLLIKQRVSKPIRRNDIDFTRIDKTKPGVPVTGITPNNKRQNKPYLQKPIHINQSKQQTARQTLYHQPAERYRTNEGVDPWLKTPYLINIPLEYKNNLNRKQHNISNKAYVAEPRIMNQKIPRPEEIKDDKINHIELQGIRHTNLVNSIKRNPQNLTKEIFIFEVMRESKQERHSVKDSKCVLLHSYFVESPICIHDPLEDEVISATLIKEQTWEPNLLYVTGRILTNNRDLKFLDLGCNLGVYTIVAAKLGINVIAVEPIKQNLRLLTKALSLGSIRNKVTMLWNAVSNIHEHVTLNDIVGNVGGSYVESAVGSKSDQEPTVRTILLDDLIPFFQDSSVFVKMDIETFEWKALQGGEKFFKTVDVAYVLMEWSYHREHGDGPEIIDFMYKRGYYPHINANFNTQLDKGNSASWPDNVLWIKYSNIILE